MLMKQFAHYLFVLFGVILMIVCLIPAIVIYMFSGTNIMPLIELELSYYERKYFNE